MIHLLPALGIAAGAGIVHVAVKASKEKKSSRKTDVFFDTLFDTTLKVLTLESSFDNDQSDDRWGT